MRRGAVEASFNDCPTFCLKGTEKNRRESQDTQAPKKKKNRTRDLQITIWIADHAVTVFCDFLCTALPKSSDYLVNSVQIQMQMSHSSNRNFTSDRIES